MNVPAAPSPKATRILPAAPSPKATRILDATRDLLLRGGARGVTIAEVAKLAHVGKGTVYLYWATKEDLIIELFVQDFVAVLDELIATLKHEPHRTVPRDLFPFMQRTLRKHPFLTAIRMRDMEFLGIIDAHPAVQGLIDAAGPGTFLAEVLPVLRAHGLVRSDLPLDTQVLAITAVLEGFFRLSMPYPWVSIPDGSHDQADTVLSQVIGLMIEPADHVPAEPAADQVLEKILAMRARAAASITASAGGKRSAA